GAEVAMTAEAGVGKLLQQVGGELAQGADREHLTMRSMEQTSSGSGGAKAEHYVAYGSPVCDCSAEYGSPVCDCTVRDGISASDRPADCGASDDPYVAMAMRLVYNSLNGSITRRIDAGIRHAKETRADGVVWFNHWGCKHTLGGSGIARKKFAEAGIPLLILDGDACDRSHGGEGQTATRLGAFLEMLNGDSVG
ncbi:MAG: 2-hydroxyacyl-CoA dehydratase family protein, partial [Lachnospiraceae bacterium]|nr:2-hydroxyacyl-CoA dehydratase family protein [Lachnospiraceae bacterium]